MRRVFDLKLFALGFRQRFVVSHFQNVFANRFAEKFGDIFAGCFRIFNCVVQNGGDKDVVIGDFTDIRQQICHF